MTEEQTKTCEYAEMLEQRLYKLAELPAFTHRANQRGTNLGILVSLARADDLSVVGYDMLDQEIAKALQFMVQAAEELIHESDTPKL